LHHVLSISARLQGHLQKNQKNDNEKIKFGDKLHHVLSIGARLKGHLQKNYKKKKSVTNCTHGCNSTIS